MLLFALYNYFNKMALENYIEFFIQQFLNAKIYIKFFLLLFFCYLAFIFINCLFEVFKFINKKYMIKKRLLSKEKKLISLRNKFYDGKINAREYKTITNQILNS